MSRPGSGSSLTRGRDHRATLPEAYGSTVLRSSATEVGGRQTTVGPRSRCPIYFFSWQELIPEGQETLTERKLSLCCGCLPLVFVSSSCPITSTCLCVNRCHSPTLGLGSYTSCIQIIYLVCSTAKLQPFTYKLPCFRIA